MPQDKRITLRAPGPKSAQPEHIVRLSDHDKGDIHVSRQTKQWLRSGATCCQLPDITWAEIALRTGKSTLLQILAGKHMVGPDAVLVLGRSAFHDVQLTSSGDLSYLGAQWRRDVAFAGYGIPLQGDLAAGDMIRGVENVDPARRQQLMDLLDINPKWRLNTVSDGQRRRVQICMGLLKPYQVLLLDEVTVDMDVVARLDLLEFLRQECDSRGATILYATHIFDGLEPWLTDLAFVSQGKLLKGGPISTIQDMPEAKLLKTVERWLRTEKETVQQGASKQPTGTHETKDAVASRATAPSFPSKHMAYFS